ncbi:pyridoxal phosphate-dependent transferase [Phlyctochytrium arcticum]|nr:pyridoxal phosphate-dependent transferase [Phlyctochytrium arcticum]
MGLYENVTEWVRLPNKTSGEAESGVKFYESPPEVSFETRWTAEFQKRQPPDFGRKTKALCFGALTGCATAFDDVDPQLEPSAVFQKSSEEGKHVEYTFLAHGSYGAASDPVIMANRKWQLKMESSPVRFFYDELYPYLIRSLRAVCDLVGARPEDTVLVTNVEAGMNAVLRSLPVRKKDVIIVFDQTYQAVLFSLEELCEKEGLDLEKIPMTFPVTHQSVIEDLRRFLNSWKQPKRRIRLALFQHVTSPTAIVLPIQELVALCRSRGILTMIDGAHALGSMRMDLSRWNADFYVTNAHKWLCSARGCAFLWIHPQCQSYIKPLVTSWGHYGSLHARFIWQGTADYSPFLSLYMAVQLYKWYGHDKIVDRNHKLAIWCSSLLRDAWQTQLVTDAGCKPGTPSSTDERMWTSMCCVQLPSVYAENPTVDDPAPDIQAQLLEQHNIEIPVFPFRGQRYVRVSLQIYNDEADCIKLGRAVLEVLNYPKNYIGFGILQGHEKLCKRLTKL